MGFRFRKSVKLMPGVRINLSARGASWTFGSRGASINVGSKGVYSNFGIPGTGLAFRQRLDSNGSDRSRGGSRLIREQIRAAKLAEKIAAIESRAQQLRNCKLSLSDSGRIVIAAGDGSDLTRKELAQMWEQQGAAILAWLQGQAEQIENETNRISQFHRLTPAPDLMPTYERVAFGIPKPAPPVRGSPIKEPIKAWLPPLGFFSNLLPWRRRAYSESVNAAECDYQAATVEYRQAVEKEKTEWEAALAQWQDDVRRWEEKKLSHETEEDRHEAEWPTRLSSDLELCEGILESTLADAVWPRPTQVALDIDLREGVVWIDVDLPEIEDFPTRYVEGEPSRKGLNIKRKSQKAVRDDYLAHIHGIGMFLIGCGFACVPAAEKVYVSGYSQRTNRATGVTSDEYLFSVLATRGGFSEIDFENLDDVDPVAALGRFHIRRKIIANSELRPIIPFSKEDAGETAFDKYS